MTRFIQIFGISILTSLFAATALANEASIKASMKARLSKVLALKDAGSVGEGADGMLHSRPGLGAEGAKVLAGENADRQAYYAIKAKQTNGSSAAVAKAMAKGFLARGKAGHWFRDTKGIWRQKK